MTEPGFIESNIINIKASVSSHLFSVSYLKSITQALNFKWRHELRCRWLLGKNIVWGHTLVTS